MSPIPFIYIILVPFLLILLMHVVGWVFELLYATTLRIISQFMDK
nr:MAG TPA: hypothetical protein [Crassvirales sp.]